MPHMWNCTHVQGLNLLKCARHVKEMHIHVSRLLSKVHKAFTLHCDPIHSCELWGKAFVWIVSWCLRFQDGKGEGLHWCTLYFFILDFYRSETESEHLQISFSSRRLDALQFAPGLSRGSTKPDNYTEGQDGLGDGCGPLLPGGDCNVFQLAQLLLSLFDDADSVFLQIKVTYDMTVWGTWMTQLLKMMGLLFFEIGNHVPCLFGCSRPGYRDWTRFTHVYGIQARNSGVFWKHVELDGRLIRGVGVALQGKQKKGSTCPWGVPAPNYSVWRICQAVCLSGSMWSIDRWSFWQIESVSCPGALEWWMLKAEMKSTNKILTCCKGVEMPLNKK